MKQQAAGQSDDSAGRAAFFRIFPAIALPVFLAMIDQSIVATALPEIAAGFRAVDQIALVVSVYLVAAAIAAPVLGGLGDRIGRKRLLIGCLLLALTGAVLAALAQNFWWLIFARVLQGFGGGGMMSLSQALLGQSVPARERAKYQGYIAGLGVTAASIGPSLGGFLTQAFGWPAVFVAVIPIQLVAFVLLRRLADTTPVGQSGRFDWLGTLYLSGLIICLITGLSLIRTIGPMAGLYAGATILSCAALLGLLLRREQRTASPILPVTSLRKPAIWRICLTTLCHGATFVSLLTFVPIYLGVLRGLSPSEVGLGMLPMTVAIGFGSMLTGVFISRTGLLAAVPAAGLLVVAVDMALLGLFAPTWPIILVVAMLGWNSLWLGTVMGVAHTTSLLEAEPGNLGAIAGAVQLSRSIGAAIGASIVGVLLVLFTRTAGYADPTEILHLAFDRVADLATDRFAASDMAALEPHLSPVFLVFAMLAATGSFVAWTNPRRRL